MLSARTSNTLVRALVDFEKALALAVDSTGE